MSIMISFECYHCGIVEDVPLTANDGWILKLPRYWNTSSDEDEHGVAEDRLFCTKRCLKAFRKNVKFLVDHHKSVAALRERRDEFYRLNDLSFVERPRITQISVADDLFCDETKYEVYFDNGMAMVNLTMDQIRLPSESLADLEIE